MTTLSRAFGSSGALAGVGSLFTARVVVGASTLVLFALLARVLEPDAFGLFGLAFSVSYLFAAVVEGGYGMLVVRDVARDPGLAGSYLGAFLPIRLASALAILALALAGGWYLDPAGPVVVLLAAAAAANLQVVAGVPRDFLIGVDRPVAAAAHAVVESALRLIVIVVVAVTTDSLTAVFVAAGIFHALFAAATLPFLWRVLHPTNILAGARAWRSLLARSMAFGAFVILGSLYAQADIVIASVLLPLAAVGVIQVAIRILVATDYLPEAAWRWAYPRLSRSAAEPQAFVRQVGRLAVALIACGIAAALALVVSAPWFVPAVFGPRYAGAVLPMQVVAAALPLRYAAHVYGTALSAGGRQGLRVWLLLAVIAGGAVVEAALIVAIGMLGVAIGIVLSSAALLVVYFGAARHAWGARLSARPPLAAVGCVAIAAVMLAIQSLA